jgi:DNA mismatch repair protein MSH3
MATLQYIVERIHCLSLFVTHYWLLTSMESVYPKKVANYHMGFLENPSDHSITFLYQLTKGPSIRSYGLNVARLAGIPSHIIMEAATR